MDMDTETVPPPAKRVATNDYRYCTHCMQTVSKRTYRKHMALPKFDGFAAEPEVTQQVI